jgi:hypothetical protein
MIETDEDRLHLEMVNHFIDAFNAAQKRGVDPDIIGSAAVAAAAAYTEFNAWRHGVAITDEMLDKLASQFRDRLRDRAAVRLAGKLNRART